MTPCLSNISSLVKIDCQLTQRDVVFGPYLEERHMKTKLSAAIICLACVLLILFLVITADQFSHKEYSPSIRNGVFDAAAYDFGKKGIVALDGEWEFYEGRLLTDTELQSGTYEQERRIVTVPMIWDNYDLPRSEPKAFGAGTYHLRILLDPSAQSLYGIKTDNIRLSHLIMINGKVAGQSGTPALSPAEYYPGNIPYASYFQVDQDALDLVIWVANHDHTPSGGIVNSVFFGTQQGIIDLRESIITNELIVSTAFFIIGLILFVVFLHRRKRTFLLYFALCNIAISLYILTHGEKLLYKLLPLLDPFLFARLQYLSASFSILMFLLYLFDGYFPALYKGKLVRLLVAPLLVFIPVAVFAPFHIHSLWAAYQAVFILAALIFSVFMLTVAILQGAEDARYMSVGALAILFIAVMTTLNVFSTVHFDTSLIYALLVFILSHTFMIAARLNRVFDQTEALSRELAIVNKNKDHFLAKTSHEFKTPLHGIINITKLFLEQEKKHLSAEQRLNLSLVIDTANRLSRLVNDILDMTKIREGTLAIEPENLQVHQELENVFAICRFVYEGKTNLLLYEAPLSLPLIRVDRDRFKQIIFNLIDNAMVHTRDSTVVLRARDTRDGVEISVEDTGGGIAPDKQQQIFEPFVALGQEGPFADRSGLGLSIAKELTELQGGTIRVESAVGQGSCFTVRFPASSRQTAPARDVKQDLIASDSQMEKAYEFEMNTPYVANPGGASTIVIADDNLTNLKILVDALAADGYKILATQSGQESLEQIKQEQNIDLVILDIMMPGMSGYEVCRTIRKDYSLAELPILMITAAIHTADAGTALQLGANDFLYKPFQLEELRARVRSLILMKQSAQLSASYEIAFLHAQIKPHFLYNALNTIAALCEIDSPKAGDLILSLAKYLRGTLDFANLSSLVSLGKELALVKAYLNIEQARFPDLSVEWNIDENIHAEMPPMVLQTLVENAVKHGIMKQEGQGTVRISITRHPDGLLFTVADDGPGLSQQELEKILEAPTAETGIGLYNTHTRLTRLYGHGLSLSAGLGKGTEISFMIPSGRTI